MEDRKTQMKWEKMAIDGRLDDSAAKRGLGNNQQTTGQRKDRNKE